MTVFDTVTHTWVDLSPEARDALMVLAADVAAGTLTATQAIAQVCAAQRRMDEAAASGRRS